MNINKIFDYSNLTEEGFKPKEIEEVMLASYFLQEKLPIFKKLKKTADIALKSLTNKNTLRPRTTIKFSKRLYDAGIIFNFSIKGIISDHDCKKEIDYINFYIKDFYPKILRIERNAIKNLDLILGEKALLSEIKRMYVLLSSSYLNINANESLWRVFPASLSDLTASSFHRLTSVVQL